MCDITTKKGGKATFTTVKTIQPDVKYIMRVIQTNNTDAVTTHESNYNFPFGTSEDLENFNNYLENEETLAAASNTEKDYAPDVKVINVEYVNKSLIGTNYYFKFGKVNKTQFALNAEFDLLENLDGEKMEVISELYVFLNNHYKYTGIRQVTNACKQWKQNYFFIRNILQKYTNIEACNVVKKHYYVKDFILDTSMFPKSVPLGTYKGVITTNIDGNKLLQLAYFLRMNFYADWQKQSPNRLNIKIY